MLEKAIEDYFQKYPNSKWKGIDGMDTRWVIERTIDLTIAECQNPFKPEELVTDEEFYNYSQTLAFKNNLTEEEKKIILKTGKKIRQLLKKLEEI